MPETGGDLLESLASAPWDVAARTFGDDHATLIGLIVHWWISGSPETRTALDGGPSFGFHPKGKGGGQCDALLCEKEQAVGLLEVEGGRFQHTAAKIGKFFNAEYPEFNSLRFAILVAYTYKLVGRGVDKKLLLVEGQLRDQEALAEIVKVTDTYPAKSVIVVTLDKEYEQQVPEVRARSWPYRGRPSVITGILYQGGQEADRHTYYERR